MISKADQRRLVQVVQRDWEVEVTKEPFKGICAGKERGHRIADFAEERTVQIIEAEGFDVAFELKKSGAKRDRSMGDVWLKSGKPPIYNPINVKAGIVGNGGQPNMVSLAKLSEAFLARKIDSYWLLLIRLEEEDGGFQPLVKLVNILDYLDYTHFDSGPGQVMLRNDMFYAYLKSLGKPSKLTPEDTVEKLLETRRDGDRRLVANREKKRKKLEAKAAKFDASLPIDQSKLPLGEGS